MSDLQVLTAVRKHLLSEETAPRVHLALPPKAIYPLVLVELEEIWSSYPLKGSGVQARIKFKVSIYSRSPGMEEAVYLSGKVKKALEGTTLRLSGVITGDQTSIIRFLAGVAETPGKAPGEQCLCVIHHFYDSVVRG